MSDETLERAEASVAAMIGSSFAGTASAPESEPEPITPFNFDAEFQTRLSTFAIRDVDFMNRVGHLLRPEHFENAGEAALVNIAKRFMEKYKALPDHPTMVQLIKDDVAAKIIKKDVLALAIGVLRSTYDAKDFSGREFFEEKVVEFARHQATTAAILKSVELLEKGEFGKIEKNIKAAIEIGINEDGNAYDYYDTISLRTAERLDDAAGVKGPRGITTGHLKLDEILYHKGWGRKELATIMGGAKAGKTTALIGFAKAASLKNFNVLYVTLEVSSRIIGERLDACMSDTEIKAISTKIKDVQSRIEAIKAAPHGALTLQEFPSGTFSPNMLRALLERYKAKGINYDLVVVDYADIMAPNFRFNDVIENSKSIYVDLRAIAQEFNVAMLTATQTNREGYKATVAKAEHVAEDFNKVRTVDLMISINITDEERSKNEARLYFAASRNQESGFTLFIKQDIAKMKFIDSIVRRE